MGGGREAGLGDPFEDFAECAGESGRTEGARGGVVSLAWLREDETIGRL